MDRNAVLIVDDDPDFRECTRLLVEEMGIPVLEAPDCRSATKLLAQEHARVRVILLDYLMPGMEPIACVGALRKLAERDVEIVLCTAAVDAAKRAAELGIARYLSKPFAIEQLRSAVAHSLARPELD
jgi:Response regulator containing CheY-like receiver, AAA-type ATPase, and DNA-binding domains